MSTINAQNYSDGVSSVPASAVLRGTAKAWATFDPSSPALTEDFNIASLTDNGTGDFSLNFTNAMSTTTYSSLFAPEVLSGSSTGSPRLNSQTTTLTRVLFFNNVNAALDPGGAHNIVSGDLA
jgi:hypothetical protein